MKQNLILFVILICTYTLSAQVAGQRFPDSLITLTYGQVAFNGTINQKLNGDSVSAQVVNGMLNGEYRSYYAGGKLKSKGCYANNLRVGDWYLYSQRGNNYMRIYFSTQGYTFVKRLKIKGSGGVRWGRGKTVSSWVIDNPDFPDTLKSVIHFRGGLKNGKVTEKYSSGKIFGTYSYSNGLYNDKRLLYYPDGNKMLEMQYSEGRPVGQRTHWSPEGKVLNRRNFDENQVNGPLTYIDEFDVAKSVQVGLWIDSTHFPSTFHFFPDSNISMISVINDAFYNSDLTAYKNPNLGEPVYSYHDAPYLYSLRGSKTSIRNLRALQINADAMFLRQTNLMYIIPVTILPVISINENDKLDFYATAWFYIPQLRPLIKENIHNPAVLNYPFLLQFRNSPDSTTDQVSSFGIKPMLNLVEQEHNLWLLEYGL